MKEKKFCKFCGKEIDKDCIICPKCGRQLQTIKKNENDNNNGINKFKKSKFNKILLIFFIISLLFLFFGNGFVVKLLAFIQGVMLICSWLMGMGFINEPKKGVRFVLAIFAFIIIIPIFNVASNTSSRDYEKLVWDEIILRDILPMPSLKKTYIYTNDDDELWISLGKASKKDYNKYVSECEKFGYEIDVDKDNDSFVAYDKNGNKIEVRYTEYDDEISIDLDIAMVMNIGSWPNSDIANLLPKPKSLKGNLEWENDDSFLYYAGDTNDDGFEEYVNELKNMGFKVDFNKGKDYYYADNENGYHVSINLEGFNIMKIQISSPSDEKIESDNDQLFDDELEDNVDNSNDNSNGMRTEFKDAMDSYEKFIDEYISFMKKYNNSNDINTELLMDYSKYMTKYVEMVDSFEKWNDEELNTEETKYYIDVQTRVSKKLLDSSL